MRLPAFKSEKLASNVEVDDAALAVLEGPAEPDHALDQKENVVDWVAFQENDLVALMTDGASPEGKDAAHGLRVVSVDHTSRNVGPQIHDIRAELKTGLQQIGHVSPFASRSRDYKSARQPIHHQEKQTGRTIGLPILWYRFLHVAARLQGRFKALNEGVIVKRLLQIPERSGFQHRRAR